MTKKYLQLYQDLFMFGWNKTKQHAWFMFLTFLIYTSIAHSVFGIPFISLLVYLMIGVSVVSVSLTMSRDHHFSFHDLFMPILSPRRVFKFLLMMLAYMVIPFFVFAFIASSYMLGNRPLLTFGILLLVPAIYVAIRFKFFAYVVVEHEYASLQELFKMTAKLTEKRFWYTFCFILVACLFNLIGAWLVVGLFVTVPITLFASARFYDGLRAHHAL